MILRLLVLTQYQRVTDGQRDRRTHTPPMPKWRSSIAERNKTQRPLGLQL